MTCEFKDHIDSTENSALEEKWVTHIQSNWGCYSISAEEQT